MFGCLFIPEYNTQSKFVENVYARGSTHNSTYVAVGNFVGYALLNMMGTLYVNIVTLTNERSCPILDNHRKSDSFFKMIFYATPILFLTTMMVNLTAKEDMDGFCHQSSSSQPPLNVALQYESLGRMTSSFD